MHTRPQKQNGQVQEAVDSVQTWADFLMAAIIHLFRTGTLLARLSYTICLYLPSNQDERIWHVPFFGTFGGFGMYTPRILGIEGIGFGNIPGAGFSRRNSRVVSSVSYDAGAMLLWDDIMIGSNTSPFQ